MSRFDLALAVIKEAGKFIITMSPTEGLESKEGRTNFVTTADIKSEEIIINAIKAEFPSDKILSEETLTAVANPLDQEHLWVIDPIDGTNNFCFQRHLSAISIGYMERGKLKFGLIYNPYRDELFWAELNKGAYLNEEKIFVRNEAVLEKAVVTTDNSAFSKGTRRNLLMAASLEPTPWILIKGCAVLAMCDVACGRTDLYFHTYLKPWDNAAAFLILKEAGALVVGFKTEEVDIFSADAVCGNVSLVNQFCAQISKFI